MANNYTMSRAWDAVLNTLNIRSGVESIGRNMQALGQGIRDAAGGAKGATGGFVSKGFNMLAKTVSAPVGWVGNGLSKFPKLALIIGIPLAFVTALGVTIASRRRKVQPEAPEVVAEKQQQLAAAYQMGAAREVQSLQQGMAAMQDMSDPRLNYRSDFAQRVAAEEGKGISEGRGA